MKKRSNDFSFPKNLISPVGSFLKTQLSELKKRKESLSQEDPFANLGRAIDNASPDADAEEQFGHARTSAIREELDRKIVQTRKALAQVKIGKYGVCINCGKMIDTDRLMIYPEAILCIKCEKKKEKK